MSDHLSTQELINRIESKDRKFRTAQAIFTLLLFVALVGVIFLQFRTLNNVREQLNTSKATAAETAKQSDLQREKIIRRLDCMVAFFSQKDRTNLSISNIDKCSLDRNGNLNDFFIVPGGTINAPANGTTPTTSSQPSQQQSTTAPKTPDTSPPVTSPRLIEPRPPVEILGVPICVPFTGICIR